MYLLFFMKYLTRITSCPMNELFVLYKPYISFTSIHWFQSDTFALPYTTIWKKKSWLKIVVKYLDISYIQSISLCMLANDLYNPYNFKAYL